MEFDSFYFKESFIDEVAKHMKEDSDVVALDSAFIARMTNYLEKSFPQYGDFDVAVGNEIRKYMKTSDQKDVMKVKRKIHDIITKAKHKFLNDVRNKAERISVKPKPESVFNTIVKSALLNKLPADVTGELPNV